MLKYMCMKWGCDELWAENFDVLIFIECRTLNRLGPMTGRQFLQKFMDPIRKVVGENRYNFFFLITMYKYYNGSFLM
jgi:hypothetical protein